jgi:hypothetical protein
MEPSLLTGLLDRMTASVSGVAAAAHSTGSSVAAITAQKHLTSTSEIVARKTDTRGTTSTMAPAVGSSAGVRKNG